MDMHVPERARHQPRQPPSHRHHGVPSDPNEAEPDRKTSATVENGTKKARHEGLPRAGLVSAAERFPAA